MDQTLYIPDDAVPQPIPDGWTQDHLAVDTLGALLIPEPGASLPIDVVVAQVRDYCWVWWRVLVSRDLILSALRACRADLVVRAGSVIAVNDVRLFGPDLQAD